MNYPKDRQTQWTLLALGVLLAVTVFGAPNARAGDPCCAITAIDARGGMVTGKQTATGRTFQFKLSDAKLLGSLKVGQAVEAEFHTGKVTVLPAGVQPGRGITGTIVNVNPAQPGEAGPSKNPGWNIKENERR